MTSPPQKTVVPKSTTYYFDRNFQLTARRLMKLSRRCSLYATGFHWLHRIRCGAFILTNFAQKTVSFGRDYAMNPTQGCAVCRANSSEGGVPHFLLQCGHKQLKLLRTRALDKGNDNGLDAYGRTLRSLNLRRSAASIYKVVNHVRSQAGQPQIPSANDEYLTTMLLGGQQSSELHLFTAATITSAVLRKVGDGALLDWVDVHMGNRQWRRAQFPLLLLCLLLTAQYLQEAMTVRNSMLWSSEYSSKPLPDSQSGGGASGRRSNTG